MMDATHSLKGLKRVFFKQTKAYNRSFADDACKEMFIYHLFMEGVSGVSVRFPPQESLKDRGICAFQFIANMTC